MAGAAAASPVATLAITAVALIAALGLRRLLWWAGRRVAIAGRRTAAQALASRGAAAARPIKAVLAAKYPKTYAAVRARLMPGRFIGLPLTLLVAAAAYMAALFGGLIEELLEADGLVRFDLALNAMLDPLRVEPFLDAFLWITALGASPAVTAVAVVATGFLWISRHPHAVVALWTTVLGAEAVTRTGKLLIGRSRPDFLEAISATSSAFPSGHATAALAVYGFLAYYLARAVADARRRFDIAYWAAVIIVLIGFSRVYLRVHYASDILGGWLVGGFWLLVGIVVAEWFRSLSIETGSKRPP